MRFSVEQWAPEYGAPQEAELAQPATEPELGVELAPQQWEPLAPQVDPVAEVLFIDGVRRVDASIWIEQPGPTAVLGLCASYAAGAVRCDGKAEVVEARVERGLFTSAAGAANLHTRYCDYPVRATSGVRPEELWLGIQQRMGELEGEVARGQAAAELVVVDGPLSHHAGLPDAVGYIKRQHVEYLPPELAAVRARLPVGRRTPLFLVTTVGSRYSWYLRLAAGEGPLSGIVRCEVAADRDVATAARLADRVAATLPKFASASHKDPRAPHNLYPIGGLERVLRRRLGDPTLLYRGLRLAAAG